MLVDGVKKVNTATVEFSLQTHSYIFRQKSKLSALWVNMKVYHSSDVGSNTDLKVCANQIVHEIFCTFVPMNKGCLVQSNIQTIKEKCNINLLQLTVLRCWDDKLLWVSKSGNLDLTSDFRLSFFYYDVLTSFW